MPHSLDKFDTQIQACIIAGLNVNSITQFITNEKANKSTIYQVREYINRNRSIWAKSLLPGIESSIDLHKIEQLKKIQIIKRKPAKYRGAIPKNLLAQVLIVVNKHPSTKSSLTSVNKLLTNNNQNKISIHQLYRAVNNWRGK